MAVHMPLFRQQTPPQHRLGLELPVAAHAVLSATDVCTHWLATHVSVVQTLASSQSLASTQQFATGVCTHWLLTQLSVVQTSLSLH